MESARIALMLRQARSAGKTGSRVVTACVGALDAVRVLSAVRPDSFRGAGPGGGETGQRQERRWTGEVGTGPTWTLWPPRRYNVLSDRCRRPLLHPQARDRRLDHPRGRPDRTYEIHEVAELTGLAAARLRAWERRYEVVRPRRMPNGYRAYTADQVALLRAFARLIEGGERIGDLVQRPREEILAHAETRSLDDSLAGRAARRRPRASTASGSRG